MKRENISSLRADSQNLRGNLLIFLDSATRTPLISLDSFRKRAAPPTSLPLRAKSCRFSLLGGEPRLSASSKKSAGGTTAPFDSDFLHHEAGEFSGASHEFKLTRFCDSQNLGKKSNKKFLLKFLLLFVKTKRRVPLNFIDFNQLSRADSQNLAIKFLKG